MTYALIALQPQANQAFSCSLDGKLAQITLETTDYGLFATVIYNGAAVATSRACLDRTDINAARYLGLPQALFFADTQGQSDPTFDGFGTRYQLCYGNPPVSQVSSAGFVFGSTGELDSTFILDQSFLG